MRIPMHHSHIFAYSNSGMLDCMRKTAKLEGITGLYKGFTPTWMRIGPWAMVSYMYIYESTLQTTDSLP